MVKPWLDKFNGKTVEKIETTEWDEILIIHFTDGSFWVIIPEKWNCSGARLVHKMDIK